MADDITMQYNTDDDDLTPKPTNSVAVKTDQYFNEITVGNQKFKVVNPDYLQIMQRRVQELEHRCATVETELRNLKAQTRQKDSVIKNAIDQLNSKFGGF